MDELKALERRRDTNLQHNWRVSAVSANCECRMKWHGHSSQLDAACMIITIAETKEIFSLFYACDGLFVIPVQR